MGRASGTVVGLVLGGALVAASGTAAQPTYRSGVTVLTIDVSVLDGNWRPQPGLTADEFEVDIDGRRQVVRTLDYSSLEAPQYTAAGRAETPERPAAAPLATAGPPRSLERTFLLFVDDLSFTPLEHKSLVSAAERFLVTLRPVDRVGLVTSSGRQTVAPTQDRGPVATALRSITGTFYSPQRDAVAGSGTRAFEGEQMAIGEAVRISRGDVGLRLQVARREGGEDCVTDDDCLRDIELLAVQIARSLDSLVDRQGRAWVAAGEALSRVEGAKVLVAISAGLPSELAATAVRRFAAAVTKSGTALHVLGQMRASVGAEDRVFPGSTGTGQDRRLVDIPFFLDGLRDAAASGGGLFYPAVGRSDDDFARVLSASAARYRLAIELPAGLLPGAVLKTRVRVKRAGLRAVAATEYVAPGPPPVLTTDEQLRAIVTQGDAYYGVPLAVTPLVRRHPNGGSLELGLHVELPATATPPLDVVFAVIGDTGRVVQSGRTRVERTSAGETQTFALAVPVPAGNYRLRMGVADSAGSVGSHERLVAVRLTKFGGLFASQLFARVIGPDDRTAVLSADVVPESATHLDVGLELYRDAAAATVTREARIMLQTESGDAVVARTVPLPSSESAWYAGVRVPLQTLPPGRYAMSFVLMEGGAKVASVSRGITKLTPAAPIPTTEPAASPGPGVAPAVAVARVIPGLPSRADVMTTLRRDASAARPAPDVARLLDKGVVVAQVSGLPGSGPANLPSASQPDAEFWTAVDQFAAGATGARADFARGVAALYRKDWATAVSQLERALDTAPDALVILRYSGAASAGIGEDRDAAGAWALSLTAPDVTADWHVAHADALVRAQDPSGAIDTLADAAARWPDDGRLTARRGELLLSMGRVDEARSDLQKALAKAPAHERTLFLLTVLAFAEVAASATPDAVATFEELSSRYLAVSGDRASPVPEWRRMVQAGSKPVG